MDKHEKATKLFLKSKHLTQGRTEYLSISFNLFYSDFFSHHNATNISLPLPEVHSIYTLFTI